MPTAATPSARYRCQETYGRSRSTPPPGAVAHQRRVIRRNCARDLSVIECACPDASAVLLGATDGASRSASQPRPATLPKEPRVALGFAPGLHRFPRCHRADRGRLATDLERGPNGTTARTVLVRTPAARSPEGSRGVDAFGPGRPASVYARTRQTARVGCCPPPAAGSGRYGGRVTPMPISSAEERRDEQPDEHRREAKHDDRDPDTCQGEERVLRRVDARLRIRHGLMLVP